VGVIFSSEQGILIILKEACTPKNAYINIALFLVKGGKFYG
jgi:hypothetical protein